MPTHEISRDGTSLTVSIPMAIRKRGGRKVVVSPAGAEPWAPSRPQIDNTLLRPSSRPSTGSTNWTQVSSPRSANLPQPRSSIDHSSPTPYG
jgi:hypothetical protein